MLYSSRTSAMLTLMRLSYPATLNSLPPYSGMRESMTVTLAPRSARRRARLLPMKPRPPVMRAGRERNSECKSGISHMFLPHHQSPPPTDQGDESAGHTGEVEKLRLAILPIPVVDGHFDDAIARVLYLPHHLKSDRASGRLEFDPVEDGAAHQAKVAIHVANAQAEQEFDEVLIRQSYDDTVIGIVPFDFVTLNHVYAIG